MAKPEQIEFNGFETLEVRARLLAEGMLAGIHRGVRPGSSPEFREFREFRPGDAIRRIDWRASARRESLQLRLREEETELHATIVVDVSASMRYKTKWEYTRTLGAALLWLLQRQGDPVRLLLLGETPMADFPCSARRENRDRMIAALAGHTPESAGCAIAGTLAELAGAGERHTLTILLSDLYCDPAELARATEMFAIRRSRLLLFHILDPSELELEWEAPVVVRDPETGRELTVRPDERRAGFRATMQQHCDALKRAATGEYSNYARFVTDMPPAEALRLALEAEREVRR